jgi:SAM-dependent methyltransferase
MNVLDMACGTGDPTIDIARTVGASGRALGLDISPAMLAIAIQRAREARLTNTTFRVIQDETKLGVEPESFDAVTCRLGLMFMPDPVAALRAWTKALKPGGRVAVCTHGALPSFEATMAVVERQAPDLANSLNWRQVLSLASIDLMEELFRDAGLTDIGVTRNRQTHIHGATISECWDSMIRRSPIYDGLQALPDSVAQGIRDSCIIALSVNPRQDLASIFGGEVLLASGRRC